MGIAAQFFKEFKNSNVPSATDVLLHYDNQKKRIEELPIDKIAIVNDEIMRYIETHKKLGNDEAAVKYNLVEYIEFLKEHNKEGLAHLVSCVESGSYPQAIVFLVTKLPQVYKTFTEFIHKI